MGKSPQMQEFVDQLAKQWFNRTQSQSHKQGVCVTCGESVGKFRNEISAREYRISGMCQKCQDSVFGKD